MLRSRSGHSLSLYLSQVSRMARVAVTRRPAVPPLQRVSTGPSVGAVGLVLDPKEALEVGIGDRLAFVASGSVLKCLHASLRVGRFLRRTLAAQTFDSRLLSGQLFMQPCARLAEGQQVVVNLVVSLGVVSFSGIAESSVDGQCNPGDVSAFIGYEPSYGVGDIRWFDHRDVGQLVGEVAQRFGRSLPDPTSRPKPGLSPQSCAAARGSADLPWRRRAPIVACPR